MTTKIETSVPKGLSEADLKPRGRVHPSPIDWRDQIFYQLLPDRFSDGSNWALPAHLPLSAVRAESAGAKAWRPIHRAW